MERSSFGKELKKLMIDNDECLIHLSELFEVSIPFVSAVISGKKNVPENWIDKITIHYELNLQEKNRLKDLADESKQMLKINLNNCSNAQRGLALQLQRNLNNLDEEEIKQLMDILGDKS